MLKKISIALSFVLFTLTASFYLVGFSTQKHSISEKKNDLNENILGKIPNELDFCGEKVPLEILDVKEKMDREMLINTFWHTNTILSLKRAHRYFPVIEKILKKNGIPEDFKYLALIESGLKNVVSHKKATGFWQILKPTAQQYHLEVNNFVDERYDYIKSTEAACLYFKKSYQKFGNWTLVAASYNLGVNGVARRLKGQQVNNYYDLLLNEETARYVFRILAAKTIFSSPKDYGFNIPQSELYKPIEQFSVIIDTPINDLVSFSKEHKINYKILKTMNPWLRKKNLPNASHKKYTIILPKESSGLIPASQVLE